MKIEEGTVRQIKITDIKGLDPIRVMIEEYEVGQAKVIIECYGESWSSYWGSMGGDIKDFFTRTNVQYLVNCFDRGIRATTDELDTYAMAENFIEQVRTKVVEERREWSLEKGTARCVYDECVRLSKELESIAPEHCYDYWKLDKCWWLSEKDWKEVFHDKEGFTEFMEYNCPNIYLPNHQYNYLSRIVSVVKEVMSGIKETNSD